MPATDSPEYANSNGNFLFVDNVRFLSMAAVVAIHALAFAWVRSAMSWPFMGVITILTSGTVGFFVISGFLLGNRLQTDSPGAYLVRRVKKLCAPWTFWFVLMVVVSFGINQSHRGKQIEFNLAEARVFGEQMYQTLFFSSFWFVPNLLLGLCLLLLFRRVLYRKEVGAVLLAVDLFYAANIYGRWIASLHTEAVFGYVFFLWLGSYASQYYAQIQSWLERIRWRAVIGFVVLGVLLSFGEGMWLVHLRAPDALSSLRLSNQVMSIFLLLAMAKARCATWPRFIEVRRTTFGVYLMHWMIMFGCWRAGIRMVLKAGTPFLRLGEGERLMFAILLFVLTYAVCLGLAGAMAGSGLAWMVGATRTERTALPKALGRPAMGTTSLRGF